MQMVYLSPGCDVALLQLQRTSNYGRRFRIEQPVGDPAMGAWENRSDVKAGGRQVQEPANVSRSEGALSHFRRAYRVLAIVVKLLLGRVIDTQSVAN